MLNLLVYKFVVRALVCIWWKVSWQRWARTGSGV